MPSWKRFDITRRYQIFFLLTAVLPILMFSAHLLENVYIKANQNLSALLESGLLYVEATVKANHNELAMSARQAAFLSLNDSYHQYLNTGNASHFQTYLEHYQKTNAFDVVLIIDPQRKILFNSSHTQPFNMKSFNTMLDESLSGRIITGFERFHDPHQEQLHLAYVAAAPIPRSYNDSRVDGVLLIGRYVKNDSAYSTLQRIMLQHRFRVLVREPEGYSVEIAANDDPADRMMTPGLEDQLKKLSRIKKPADASVESVFKEYILESSYLTRLFPLNNQHSETAGYIAISVPRAELKDFMKENLGFITLFIAVLMVWILMAGRWFHQDVIEPMGALTQGLRRVAEEDLTTRIPLNSTYHKEARETIQSFNMLVNRLEETEQLRDTFISMLSHDLKTPLLAQQRVTTMLQESFDEAGEPKLGKLLGSLRRSNEDLLEMVYTLLETYQYEDGQIVLMREPVLLGKLMTDCFETLRPLAEESGIITENLIPKDFPVIEADPLQLKRLFQNLLSNAIQNIPEECRVWADAKLVPGGIRIYIEDNGPGLSDKVRKRLFERYNSGPRLRKRIGSGLGLFICRKIVEMHSGTIEVSSATGRGTRFSITLPQDRRSGS